MKLDRDGRSIEITSRRRIGPRPELRDDRLVLQAESEWLVAGAAADLDGIQAALMSIAERLSTELLLLDFGNAVGLMDVPIVGLVEVVSGKWDQTHFDAMLHDLTTVASALPFAAGAPTALPYDRSVAAREDVLYHAFVYLRHILLGTAPTGERLVPAYEQILREPHRRLERIRAVVPVELVRRLDPAGLVLLATGGGRPTAVETSRAARLPLARALRGHLPTEVDEGQIRSTYDTPENRFVKAFLGQALGVLDAMRLVVGSSARSSLFGRRVVADCDMAEQVLRPIVSHPFWRQIGTMTQVPVASTVLQRRRGYRDVFGHFSRLRLAARVPIEPRQMRRLLESKDIAELYELWVYFAIVREVERFLGIPVRVDRTVVTDLAVSVRRSFTVEWGDGTRLLYNATFSRSQLTARRSYSVPLRPDVALEVSMGPNVGLHLFDAKFKLDRLDTVLGTGDETEAAEERRGTFKRGDLYKMHTYRDAIPRARSVWILYPGDDLRFFPQHGVPVERPAALPAEIDGVGSIPVRPGEEALGELRGVLSKLLASG